jgi:hypothetical protein
MASNIKCPHCGKVIEITEVLHDQVQLEVRAEVEAALTRKIEADLTKKYEEKARLEVTDLKNELVEKEKRLKDFREQELKIREEKRALEDKSKNMDLELARRLDEERQKIEAVTMEKMSEENRLKSKEKDKVIDDLKKSLEDAQRRAQQGSQQLQGEVLELDLEETLRHNFSHDLIEPIEKGTRGADVRQTVRTSKGTVCGTILWELKRTKAWAGDWIPKLKADLREEHADIPVIVSSVLPKEIKTNLGNVENVWVCDFSLAMVLADILRRKLIDVAREKFIAKNKESKSEAIYDYVTSNEFIQHVESLAEVFNEMQEQIHKEKVAFEKIWKVREAQSQRLFKSTAAIVGEMQGRVGSSSMPAIKGLEVMELGDGE